MSEVVDRAKETEVDRGTAVGQPTDEVLSHPTTQPNLNHEKDSITLDEIVARSEVDAEKDADIEGDSEAETLIQSPEKKRAAANATSISRGPGQEEADTRDRPGVIGAPSGDIQSRKRKRSNENGYPARLSPNPSHRSSPLSSPIGVAQSLDSDSDHSSRQKGNRDDVVRNRRNGERDSSRESERGVGVHSLRQRRPSDIAPHKRDKHNNEISERRETRSATYPRHSDDERSPSPQPIPRRDHRRGVSTQLTAHEFGKKRGRPPLISTRRNRSAERAASISSDGSNSPAPPRSAVHKLAGHDQDTMSPAKTGPRKWRDKNGRTFLARACNNNDLESAKARLAERPEDLNWADNAGNTPLQIAALEGFIDIVKFLLEAGCDVDTRNIDKETPLIDAVENGHVEVVKLLLDHSANPRLGNAKGDEPFELVPQDDENYEEIRGLLAEAKERENRRHRLQDQVEAANRDGNSSRAASAASPRDSPPINPRSPPTMASRRRTGRSESTRNDLLWQANTQENLTKLAGKGDVQGVASILNILQKAETESLIAAAKAGHEEVLQYLLGMGDPEPDPDPVRSLKPGFNTPMLAAIGRGHVDVIKLLVSQSGFNPTRKYKDKAYYELSKERKGEDWQTEHEILKKAYDNYASSKGRKANSPRKTRDSEKIKARAVRRSSSPGSQKPMSSSPTMTHKSLSSSKSSESSPRDKRKLPETDRRKISVGKHDTADGSVAVASDMDQTIATSKKGHRVRRSQSDLPTLAKLESETMHRRRRLVTGKEHRRNKSAAPGSEPDEDSKEVIVVKQEEKPTPTLKRARSRTPLTPEAKESDEIDRARQATKKRRTVLESSPDEARTISKASRSIPRTENLLPSTEVANGDENGTRDLPMTNVETESDHKRSGDGDLTSTVTKLSDPEILPDADPTLQNETPPDQMPTQDMRMEAQAVAEKEKEREKEQKREEEKEKERERQRQRTEALAKEQAEREAQAEAERRAARESERILAEAEAERAEAARLAAAEEERRLAGQREAEEAETRRKAEEEALRRKEEEDRQEQLRRELEDRRRLQHLENERHRRESLPIVLSRCAAMVDENDPTTRSLNWLSKFLPLFTVKTRQIDSGSTGEAADDQWVANFQVASLLATKDLNLRNFTSVERRHCTPHERQCLWRVARNMLSFEYQANGMNTSVKQATQRENENRPKFLAMEELYWVKLSDFKDQVFRHPHLSALPLRTQPISLASYASLAQRSASQPQINGTSPTGAKLTNGIHTHNDQVGNGVEQYTL